MKRIDLIKNRLVAWSSGICTLDETTTKMERMILEEREECTEIARNYPIFSKSGNMKSADIVRREIAIAIEKNREA